jgi:hypothetical protein
MRAYIADFGLSTLSDSGSATTVAGSTIMGTPRWLAPDAHNIVSSAFVPSVVLNHMQETHYLEASPSTSCVEEVVEQPAPTPAPTTIIGEPS